MKEAVRDFLCGGSVVNPATSDDWDEIDEKNAMNRVRDAVQRNGFEIITSTCRAIRVAIKRSHKYQALFLEFQAFFDVQTSIKSDVVTRFDSTLEMFDSVLMNQSVLKRMQERGKRNTEVWPSILYLSVDDFNLIKDIVEILEPLRGVTKVLSTTNAWVGDVLPLMCSAIDQVTRLEVSSAAMTMKRALIASLSCRIRMLLEVDEDTDLPCTGGAKMGSQAPTEFVLSAYLNPRFRCAVHAYYGYSDRVICCAISKIYRAQCDEDESQVEEKTCTVGNEQPADAWVSRLISGNPTNRTNNRDPVRSKFLTFRSELGIRRFSATEAREYWMNAKLSGKFQRLGRVARLFMTIPASSVPQERHFSELKRRSAGSRNKTKFETLDRDAVVSTWKDKMN